MYNMHEHPRQGEQSPRFGWLQSRKMNLVLLGFLIVGAFFLLTEHTAHLLGVLPFLIFLLCPLMMLFMHGGHGDHGGQGGQQSHRQPYDEPPSGGQP